MGLEVIANAVKVDDGVKYLSMYTLKKYAAPHRDRLSRDLCTEISAMLDKAGLITLPKVLPTYENHWVFVIEKGTALGQAVTLATRVVGISKLGAPTPAGIHQEYPTLTAQVG